jgi:hypothetical protein
VKCRCIFEDNIKMDIKEIERECTDWIHLAQDKGHWRALVNMLMNIWVPLKTENFLTSRATVSF